MYTLLYLKRMTHKDPLYSTWNSCSMLCASLDGRGVWERRDTCICMAESFCCSPETTRTVLIVYNLIQNKNFKQTKLTTPDLKIINEPVIIKKSRHKLGARQFIRAHYNLIAKDATVNKNSIVLAPVEVTKPPSKLVQQLEDKSNPIL